MDQWICDSVEKIREVKVDRAVCNKYCANSKKNEGSITKKPWLIKNQGFDVFVAGAGLEPTTFGL